MDILKKTNLLERLYKLSGAYIGAEAQKNNYQMILKSLRELYVSNKTVYSEKDIKTINEIKDKIDNFRPIIRPYGTIVCHRDKKYRGITDGTTNLKHLFEDERNEQEYRVRVSDGKIKIASPDNLEFIGVAAKQPTTRNKGYENFCYECHKAVGPPDKKCSDCHWYICSDCGSCGCGHRKVRRYR